MSRTTAPKYARKAYAVYDPVTYTESALETSSAFTTTLDGRSLVTLDVMANDQNLTKGGTRTIYSVDDGVGTDAQTQSDLLVKDATTLIDGHTVSQWGTTAGGNQVRIYDNQVQLDLKNSLGGKTVAELTSGQSITDSFAYAIQMSDGTLSWNRVTFTLAGEDDPAQVTNAGTFGLIYAYSDTQENFMRGADLTVYDPDYNQSAFLSWTTHATWGTFNVNFTAQSVHWEYTIAPKVVVPFDYDHATFSETLTVTTADGTQAQVEVLLQDRALRTNDGSFQGSNDSDVIYGGPGGNIILGMGGDDTIWGGSGGSDDLQGGDGNDSLHGSPNNDYLEGGNGNDYLGTGGGSDILTGGPGSDIYALDIASGMLGVDNSRIVGFESGQDRIRLSTAPGSAFAPLANYPNQVMVGNFIFYDAASGWITVDLDGSGDAYGEAALIRLQAEGSTGLPIALSDADFLIVGSTPGPVL